MRLNLIHPPIAPWIIPAAGGWRVRLHCAGVASSAAVFLRIEPDNEEYLIAMRALPGVGSAQTFEAFMPWDNGNDTAVYVFKIVQDGGQHWLAADGMHAYTPPRELHFRVSRDFVPPLWVRDQVFYQIFPDRFCQGFPEQAVQTGEYVYAKGNAPVTRFEWNAPIDQRLGATAFYGGDLQGIEQRLGYLQHDLGITAIYLNPVFTSGSNHKYDTEDYFRVDPHLGGNAAFSSLMGAVHARGMKLILDIVINHTGANHPWFNRFGRHDTQGAFNSEQSPYRNWYSFSASGKYAGWKGMPHIPVLDFANPVVRDVMYQGSDSVVRHWMRPPYAVDGWRFDVMHMIGEGAGAKNNAVYVKQLRGAIKEENPEAFMLGEQFYEATRWLQGEQEDAGMNYYGFVQPVRAWLAERDINYDPIRIDASTFDDWLAQSRARIPYVNQLVQFNLLDSHDTQRMFTSLSLDENKMRLAIALLMTYPGVPCIYYGDEIGIEGGRDPECRRCFHWERSQWNENLFSAYRSMIALRKRREEFRHGAYATLQAEGDVFVYARFTEERVSVVALNRADCAREFAPDWGRLPLECERWSAFKEGDPASPHIGELPPASVCVWMADARPMWQMKINDDELAEV